MRPDKPTGWFSRRRLSAALCLSLLAVAGCQHAARVPAPSPPPASISRPPVAAAQAASDVYAGGQSIVDPYLWMENLDSPASRAWLNAQARYTGAVLQSIPGRAALLQRIRSLEVQSEYCAEPELAGTRLFYLKYPASALCVRDGGLGGEERVLVAPDASAPRGTHATISYYEASPDGRYAVVGISAGGSENAVIRVVDASSGKWLPERIDRARFGRPSWLPDSRSFFYTRLPPPGGPWLANESEERGRCFVHKLGADPARDPVLFGYGVSSVGGEIPATAICSLTASAGSPYVLAKVKDGVDPNISVYAAPLAALSGTTTPWMKIAGKSDEVLEAFARGSSVYLLTYKTFERSRIVVTSMAHPDLDTAATLAPAHPGDTIDGFGVARDAVYCRYKPGGSGRDLLERVSFDGTSASLVPLPAAASILEFSVDQVRSGIWAMTTGWTQPPLWYAYDPISGLVADTGLMKPPNVDFSDVQAVETTARARDGAQVPLSILMPKGCRLDGSHPTILTAYGAFGHSLMPRYSPVLLAWIERGGIYAVAHVRGGSELGPRWYGGGYKATKANTWNDLIACAERLESDGYTSAPRLALQGGSAGGIAVGRAFTECPDLCAVVLDDVGVSDTLRAQYSPNGALNTAEFGDANAPADFGMLYGMDSYLHVKDGAKYPAVLLTTGINDARVSPWQSMKMAARLQAATTSGRPVLLRVDYDAGHGNIGSDLDQSEQLLADKWSFALWQMGVPGFQPSGTRDSSNR